LQVETAFGAMRQQCPRGKRIPPIDERINAGQPGMGLRERRDGGAKPGAGGIEDGVRRGAMREWRQ
jgi:hypothetical protein